MKAISCRFLVFWGFSSVTTFTSFSKLKYRNHTFYLFNKTKVISDVAKMKGAIYLNTYKEGIYRFPVINLATIDTTSGALDC